jgi:hypothetical protein
MSCGCGRISETIALGSIAVSEQVVSVEAPIFPCPTARVPIVGSAEARSVNHRQPLRTRQISKILYDLDGAPGLGTARIPPVLD